VTAFLSFDNFVPGDTIGSATDRVDQHLLQTWAEIYSADPPTGDNTSTNLAAALVMRAYLEVVSPRPAGNIHVGEVILLHDAPAIGEILTTVVKCHRKEVKRERRFVEFSTYTTGNDGRSLIDAKLKLIWAA
jgi:hypothetical protein